MVTGTKLIPLSFQKGDKFGACHHKRSKMIKIKVNNEEETFLLGKRIGQLLQSSMILCLSGDMGTGKTHFTKGIAAGLGIEDYITSPTFTLINEYKGRIPLYHFDVYRLENSDELNELGYQEYFFGSGVTVIEWADIINDVIPKDRLWIILHKIDGDKRRIIIDGAGEEYISLVEELKNLPDIKPLLDEGGVRI